MGLKTTTIPRHVKVQHIKGIPNILADSVSMLKAVDLYHDLDFNDNPRGLRHLLNPYRVKKATHTLAEIHEIFIKPDIEDLTQNYEMQTAQQPQNQRNQIYY